MPRRGAAAVIALALSAAACANGYERALIAQFFAASRLRDGTALQTVSTVMFDPSTDGTVLQFDLNRISPENSYQKRATISARVRRPDGDTVQENLIVTMRRTDPAVDTAATSRWIITGVARTR